jgi:hypoxanthine phosphoribosyltransferase
VAADLERVLIDRGRIAARVAEMADQIEGDVSAMAAARGEELELAFLPVMTGAMIFVADLIRCLPRRLRIHPITASSYPGKATRSTGTVTVSGVPADLSGRDVLLVDDILDSGRTLSVLQAAIRAQTPRSLRTCVLLRKDVTRAAEADCDYVGFEIPDAFVVGYGLDHDGLHRNLPDIGILRTEAR